MKTKELTSTKESIIARGFITLMLTVSVFSNASLFEGTQFVILLLWPLLHNLWFFLEARYRLNRFLHHNYEHLETTNLGPFAVYPKYLSFSESTLSYFALFPTMAFLFDFFGGSLATLILILLDQVYLSRKKTTRLDTIMTFHIYLFILWIFFGAGKVSMHVATIALILFPLDGIARSIDFAEDKSAMMLILIITFIFVRANHHLNLEMSKYRGNQSNKDTKNGFEFLF